MSELPILYSFRRCPYAMRARLALHASNVQLELREVVLRDKPAEMLAASPKGTVPVLVLPDGEVLEESIDIIHWALRNAKSGSEAESWVREMALQNGRFDELIKQNDGGFKAALDAYKYPNRFPDRDRTVSRDEGAQYIQALNETLTGHEFLYSPAFSVFDASVLPFIRQFAHVDQDWFYAQKWENVLRWLDAFKNGDRFKSIMNKYDQWRPGQAQVLFGGEPQYGPAT